MFRFSADIRRAFRSRFKLQFQFAGAHCIQKHAEELKKRHVHWMHRRVLSVCR
jgi:Leu/Phe-tRNA-protein transferase